MGEEGEASRAELELLLAEDDGGDANVKGYSLKRNKSKGKKGKQDDVDDEKISTVGYDDPRFSSLFNIPDYFLDPTDPQFKKFPFCWSHTPILLIMTFYWLKKLERKLAS